MADSNKMRRMVEQRTEVQGETRNQSVMKMMKMKAGCVNYVRLTLRESQTKYSSANIVQNIFAYSA